MKIKRKAELLLLGISIATSVISAYSGYVSAGRLIENAKIQEMQQVATLIQQGTDELSARAASRAVVVANLPPIQAAFRAQNRDEIVKIFGAAFKEQHEEFGLRELHFFLPPATSFLRLSDPTVGHGEDQSSFRQMILAANRNHEPQRGIELGRRGVSVRADYCVKDDKGFIGVAEIELGFGSVLTNAKKLTGFEAGAFVNDKLMVERATLVPRPDSEHIVGEYQGVESTNWNVVRGVVTADDLAANHDISTRLMNVKGVDFGAVFVPLLDYKGAKVGTIVAARDFSSYQTKARWLVVSSVAAAVFQIVLLSAALLLIINGMIFKPLAALDEGTTKLRKGEEAPEVDEIAKMKNELGGLAEHIASLAKEGVPKPEVKEKEGAANAT